MQKKNILKKNWEFSTIISNGKQIVTKSLILYYLKSENSLKVGISVPSKFALANKRAFYRNQVRNILDFLNIWHLKYNIVIILRKPFLAFDFAKKTEEIKQIIERI